MKVFTMQMIIDYDSCFNDTVCNVLISLYDLNPKS